MIVYMDAFSSVDWDGKIVATLFVCGCPFDCWYCHNRELIGCGGKKDLRKELMSELENISDFIDGVCITGGEPTAYKHLEEVVKEIKDLGLQIKLDTNGYFPDILGRVVKVVDYVAMDVKETFDNYNSIMLSEKNINPERLRKSVSILMGGEVDYEFRTTVLDTSCVWIRSVAEQVKGAKKYVLQRLRIGDRFMYDKEDLEDCAERLEIEGWFDKVVVR